MWYSWNLRNSFRSTFGERTLSYLTFNCNAQWQFEEAISEVRSKQDTSREWLSEPFHYLQDSLLPPILAFFYLQEWGMSYLVWPMPLQQKDIWRVVWQVTHVTSDVSDKCAKVDVVFDLYLSNFLNFFQRRKGFISPKGDLSRGIRKIVESRGLQTRIASLS